LPWSADKWPTNCKEANTSSADQSDKAAMKPNSSTEPVARSSKDLAMARTLYDNSAHWPATSLSALCSVGMASQVAMVDAMPEMSCLVDSALSPSISPITFIHIYHLISNIGR